MVSDEQIVAAVIKNGTMTKAAYDLGISMSTVYRRMAKPACRIIYKSFQHDLLKGTVETLSDVRCDAIETIETIMNDETINPAIRLQAAQSILANDTKFADRLTEGEKEIKSLMLEDSAEKATLEMAKAGLVPEWTKTLSDKKKEQQGEPGTEEQMPWYN